MKETLPRFLPYGRVGTPLAGLIDCLVLYTRIAESHVWSPWLAFTYLGIRPVQVIGVNVVLWYADRFPENYHSVIGTFLLWIYRIFVVYFISQDMDVEAHHHPAHLVFHTFWTPTGAAILLPTLEEHILGALAIVSVKPFLYLAGVQCINATVCLEMSVRIAIAAIGIYINFEVHSRRRENWISSSRFAVLLFLTGLSYEYRLRRQSFEAAVEQAKRLVDGIDAKKLSISYVEKNSGITNNDCGMLPEEILALSRIVAHERLGFTSWGLNSAQATCPRIAIGNIIGTGMFGYVYVAREVHFRLHLCQWMTDHLFEPMFAFCRHAHLTAIGSMH
jgi:hypothetical protein